MHKLHVEHGRHLQLLYQIGEAEQTIPMQFAVHHMQNYVRRHTATQTLFQLMSVLTALHIARV